MKDRGCKEKNNGTDLYEREKNIASGIIHVHAHGAFHAGKRPV